MRIGILGAGDMGAMHARLFSAIPGVEIAAVVGRYPDRVAKLGAELDVEALTDPRAIIDDDTVDAVDITYPSALHRELAVAALERDKHVLCETPMALNVDDANAMISAARARNRILMPAQVHRFGVEASFIHEQVAAGTMGEPVAAYASSRSAPYGAGNRRPVDLYGGPMLDLMIHPFDTLNWLLGQPLTVSGAGQIGPSGTYDYAFVTLDFGDASGLAEGSAMMPQSFPFTISLRVLCADGALEARLRLGPEEDFGLVRYPKTGDPELLTLEGGDPYARELENFVDCVREGSGPTVASAEGEREAIRIALAAEQAIEQGTTVTL